MIHLKTFVVAIANKAEGVAFGLFIGSALAVDLPSDSEVNQ